MLTLCVRLPSNLERILIKGRIPSYYSVSQMIENPSSGLASNWSNILFAYSETSMESSVVLAKLVNLGILFLDCTTEQAGGALC